MRVKYNAPRILSKISVKLYTTLCNFILFPFYWRKIRCQMLVENVESSKLYMINIAFAISCIPWCKEFHNPKVLAFDDKFVKIARI